MADRGTSATTTCGSSGGHLQPVLYVDHRVRLCHSPYVTPPGGTGVAAGPSSSAARPNATRLSALRETP